MPPNITEILEKVEQLMNKYGYVKVTVLILALAFIWKLPQLITAIRWW